MGHLNSEQVAIRLLSLAERIRGALDGDEGAEGWASELEVLAEELKIGASPTGLSAVEGEEGGRGEPSSPSLPHEANVIKRETYDRPVAGGARERVEVQRYIPRREDDE